MKRNILFCISLLSFFWISPVSASSGKNENIIILSKEEKKEDARTSLRSSGLEYMAIEDELEEEKKEDVHMPLRSSEVGYISLKDELKKEKEEDVRMPLNDAEMRRMAIKEKYDLGCLACCCIGGSMLVIGTSCATEGSCSFGVQLACYITFGVYCIGACALGYKST